jgi:hypothetical protein
MCNCTLYPCPPNPVWQNYLGQVSYDTRYANGWFGLIHTHSGTQAFEYDSPMLTSCNGLANALATYLAPLGTIDFIGSPGVQVCKQGEHSLGRAMDISAIWFTNSNGIDTNYNWQAPSIAEQRRYLAIVATCRMYFSTVLAYYYNAAHHDHVHVDMGTAPVVPLDYNLTSDRGLLKLMCNLQLGYSFVVDDGTWTWDHINAVLSLLSTMGMNCLNPFTNIWHMWAFLANVASQAGGGYGAFYVSGMC